MARKQLPDGFDRTNPRVLYQTKEYRMVLRALDSWPEGYVEFEFKQRDAIGDTAWHHVGGCSLDLAQLSGHSVERRLLIELILDLDSRLRHQIKPRPRL